MAEYRSSALIPPSASENTVPEDAISDKQALRERRGRTEPKPRRSWENCRTRRRPPSRSAPEDHGPRPSPSVANAFDDAFIRVRPCFRRLDPEGTRRAPGHPEFGPCARNDALVGVKAVAADNVDRHRIVGNSWSDPHGAVGIPAQGGPADEGVLAVKAVEGIPVARPGKRSPGSQSAGNCQNSNRRKRREAPPCLRDGAQQREH